MSTKVTTFSLRLPVSLKATEKISAIHTAETFFAARKGNVAQVLAFLSRSEGEVSRKEDRID